MNPLPGVPPRVWLWYAVANLAGYPLFFMLHYALPLDMDRFWLMVIVAAFSFGVPNAVLGWLYGSKYMMLEHHRRHGPWGERC
jgi:hypothetical protein